MSVVRAGLVAALLLASSAAEAFHLEIRRSPASGGSQQLTGWVIGPSELAIVDVYLDAEPGLQIAAVAVEFDDIGALTYEPALTSLPSYILYTPGAGATPATYLYPHFDPPPYWAGMNVPGKRAIHLEYISTAAGTRPAAASGNDIWIGSIVFHVNALVAPGWVDIDLSLDQAQGSAIYAYDNDVTASSTATGNLTFVLPEPELPLLVGFGLAALALLARRRA